MAENKTMDDIHKGLLKKFHTLCNALGMSADEKRATVEAYGVESSRDIDTHDLVDLCGKLSNMVSDQKTMNLDRQRKRCMAAIGAWLRAAGMEGGISKIKGIACRAAGYDDFNKIPMERLRNLVYLFNNKVKDAEGVEGIVSGKVIPLVKKED